MRELKLIRSQIILFRRAGVRTWLSGGKKLDFWYKQTSILFSNKNHLHYIFAFLSKPMDYKAYRLLHLLLTFGIYNILTSKFPMLSFYYIYMQINSSYDVLPKVPIVCRSQTWNLLPAVKVDPKIRHLV